MRRHGIVKRSNNYVEVLGEVYEACPKAVMAAIAVSMLTNGGDELEHAKARLVAEWGMLYDNGIVSQKPKRN